MSRRSCTYMEDRSKRCEGPGGPTGLEAGVEEGGKGRLDSLWTNEQSLSVTLMGKGEVMGALVPTLRRSLTLLCMECGKRATNEETMGIHLETQHQVLYKQSLPTMNLLRCSVFARMGCVCNPGPKWGMPGHTCVPLHQLAMQCYKQKSLLIPWRISEGKTQILLENLSSDANPRWVQQCLVARRFEELRQDPNLRRIGDSQCMLCGEILQLKTAEEHYRTNHGPRLAVIYFRQQMTAIKWEPNSNTAYQLAYAIVKGADKYPIEATDWWPEIVELEE